MSAHRPLNLGFARHAASAHIIRCRVVCLLLAGLGADSTSLRAEPARESRVGETATTSAGPRAFALPLPDEPAPQVQSLFPGVDCGDFWQCFQVPAIPDEAQWVLCGGGMCAYACGAGMLSREEGREREALFMWGTSIILGAVLGATLGGELAKRNQVADTESWSLVGGAVGVAVPVAIGGSFWLLGEASRKTPAPPRDRRAGRRRSRDRSRDQP